VHATDDDSWDMLQPLAFLALSILCGIGAYYHAAWPDWLRESESRWWDSAHMANVMRGLSVASWVVGCIAFACLMIATA
jgi:hypothetical protein